MTEVTINRTFSLDGKLDINLQEVFDEHQTIVNDMIEIGFEINRSMFEKDSLYASKRFYNLIRRRDEFNRIYQEYQVKERLVRCASEYAYFSVHNYYTKLKIIINCNKILQDMYYYDFIALTKDKDNKRLEKKIIIDFCRNIEDINYAYAIRLLAEIKRIVSNFLSNTDIELTDNFYKQINDRLEDTPVKFLPQPKFDGLTISLSSDDSSVYQLEENKDGVQITLSFYARQFTQLNLNTPQRYYDLIKKGWQVKTGVLELDDDKLLLHIPFTKKVTLVNPPFERIAGVDLGLKTLAVISIKENDTEIDRIFMKQKHLSGSKTEWYNNYEAEPINFKSTLIKYRKSIKRLRRKIHNISDPSARKSARRELNRLWQKISNLHQEMSHQIGTRVVGFCKSHNVELIRIENLKWVQQSKKSASGSFLNFWSVHWHYAKIQEIIISQGLQNGIQVHRVTARYSSQLCSKCHQKGHRNSKIFYCRRCDFTLDADLNAARNLASSDWPYESQIKMEIAKLSTWFDYQ